MLSPELQATLQRAVADDAAAAPRVPDARAPAARDARGPDRHRHPAQVRRRHRRLRVELEQFLTENVEELPEGEESGPEQTLAFQRVLQRAAMHVQGAGAPR